MNPIIKKKKISLIEKIIGKIKSDLSYEQRDINSNIPLGNSLIDDKDIAAIELRRKELLAANHGNTNVILSINDKNVKNI